MHFWTDVETPSWCFQVEYSYYTILYDRQMGLKERVQHERRVVNYSVEFVVSDGTHTNTIWAKWCGFEVDDTQPKSNPEGRWASVGVCLAEDESEKFVECISPRIERCFLLKLLLIMRGYWTYTKSTPQY